MSAVPATMSPCPGTAAVEAARSTGLIGSSSRRSCGVCGWWTSPATIERSRAGDVGVVVEAEDGVGLGQRLGEVLAVALGQAADGDDGLGLAALVGRGLQVRGLQQGVDRVLLGRLDEAAGVDHDRVGVGRVVDEQEAVGGEPAGQLLGVDLVAGAAQGQHRDRQLGRRARSGSWWSAGVVLVVIAGRVCRRSPQDAEAQPDPGPAGVPIRARRSAGRPARWLRARPCRRRRRSPGARRRWC